MRWLGSPAHIISSCTLQALKHPRRRITHCSTPLPSAQSPLPWFVCVLVIVLGITTWILSAVFKVSEISEVARPMIYGPLAYMFGRGQAVSQAKKG